MKSKIRMILYASIWGTIRVWMVVQVKELIENASLNDINSLVKRGASYQNCGFSTKCTNTNEVWGLISSNGKT